MAEVVEAGRFNNKRALIKRPFSSDAAPTHSDQAAEDSHAAPERSRRSADDRQNLQELKSRWNMTPSFPHRTVDKVADALDSEIRRRLSIFANANKSRFDSELKAAEQNGVRGGVDLKSGDDQRTDDLLRQVGAALGLPEKTKLKLLIAPEGRNTVIGVFELKTNTPLAGFALPHGTAKQTAATIKTPQYYVALDDLKKFHSNLMTGRNSRLSGMFNYGGYDHF
jgi:hypothetical protein